MNTQTAAEPLIVTAYLVAIVHRETRLVGHIGIYSEPSPTCPTTHDTLVLFECKGCCYADAKNNVDAMVRLAMRSRGNA
jgi:hypothetical protein